MNLHSTLDTTMKPLIDETNTGKFSEVNDALTDYVKAIEKYKKQLTKKSVKGDLKKKIIENLSNIK